MSRCLLPTVACVISWMVLPTMAADPLVMPPVLSYPRPTAVEERIRDALLERTEIAFTDTPLSDAIDFLRDVHQIQIVIDTAALQDEGVDPSSPVNLELSGITLQSALSLMLRPLILTTVIEDEVLKVTTLAKIEDTFVTRVYPVHDLASDAEELASLIGAIRNGSAVGRWAKPDGTEPVALSKSTTPAASSGGGLTPTEGSIVGLAKSRSLVIRHSHPVHEEIEALLKNLRAAEADFAEFTKQHAPRTAEIPTY